MLSAEMLLQAMSGIRESEVLRAGHFLGYNRRKAARGANRRLWRTLLIAAVLISLLAATVYAVGRRSLRERMIETKTATDGSRDIFGIPVPADSPVPTVVARRWVSLNGDSGSAEYQANAEWLSFQQEYLAAHGVPSDEQPWAEELDEQTQNIRAYYGAFDKTMLDELFRIAEKYELRLHTERVFPLTLEDFYRTAGTGRFLDGGSGSGYVYEDGSFKLEFQLERNGPVLVLLKSLPGSVLPYASGMDDPENYEEWEYTNVHGDTVWIAYNALRSFVSGPKSGEALIFYETENMFARLSASGQGGLLSNGRESCERLADAVNFGELTRTEADLSAVYHESAAAENAGDAATLEDFLASREGAALWEYNQSAWHLGGTAEGRERQETIRRGLCEQYGLTPSRDWWEVCSQEKLDAGLYAGYPVMSDKEFTARGYDERITEQFSVLEFYDNGIIAGISRLRWCYIPDGALCSDLIEPFRESYIQQWFYRTRCGALVQICADEADPGARAMILYRTSGGWVIGQEVVRGSTAELEVWADELDFTLFP